MLARIGRAISPIPVELLESLGPPHQSCCRGTDNDIEALNNALLLQEDNSSIIVSILNTIDAPIELAIGENHAKCVGWFLREQFNYLGNDILQVAVEKMRVNDKIDNNIVEEILINGISPITGRYYGVQDKTAFLKYAIKMKRYELVFTILAHTGDMTIDMDNLMDNKICDKTLPPIYIALGQYKNKEDDLCFIELLLISGATFDIGYLRSRPEFAHMQAFLEDKCKAFMTKRILYKEKEAVFDLLEKHNMTLNGFTKHQLQHTCFFRR